MKQYIHDLASEFLDSDQISILDNVDYLVEELGLPSSAITSEKEKILGKYLSSSLSVQGLLYFIDSKFRFESIISSELKANNLEMNLSEYGSYASASAMLNLDSSYNDSLKQVAKLESFKNYLFGVSVNMNSILRLYGK